LLKQTSPEFVRLSRTGQALDQDAGRACFEVATLALLGNGSDFMSGTEIKGAAAKERHRFRRVVVSRQMKGRAASTLYRSWRITAPTIIRTLRQMEYRLLQNHVSAHQEDPFRREVFLSKSCCVNN
jgi:hypothetical protein